MTNIIATGLSGLVGNRVKTLLFPQYSFTDISLSTGIDITKKDELNRVFKENNAPWVVHLAALADVDKCEKEKEIAFEVNVVGTRNIVAACREFHKKLIHISTDFVFPGHNEEYFETSPRQSLNYYSETKILAENEVLAGLDREQSVILRISSPYCVPVVDAPKKSFFQKMLETLKAGQELIALEDIYSRPTFIDDIAQIINLIIQSEANGIFHCVGDSFLSVKEQAEQICQVFGLNSQLIKIAKSSVYFLNRATRPRFLDLNNDKIKKELGVKLHTFKEGILKINESC